MWDAEVRAVHGGAVVEHVVRAQPALEVDLRLRGWRRRGGGEDRYEKKGDFLPAFQLRFLTPCQHWIRVSTFLSFSVRPLNHKSSLQKTPHYAPSSHCDFTHHHFVQVGDGVDKRLDPLEVGLWGGAQTR